MTEYTPNDGDIRWQYVVKRMHDGATRTHAEQECTRWLTAHDAHVRREAIGEVIQELQRVGMTDASSYLIGYRDRSPR